MSRLSPAQRWVLGLGALALLCFVVGVIGIIVAVVNAGAVCAASSDALTDTVPCPGDTSGWLWGGALVVVGLLDLGLTGLAGAIVWTSAPTIAPRRPKRPAANLDENRVFTVGPLLQSHVQDRLFDGVVRTVEDSLAEWRLEAAAGADGRPVLRRGTAEDRVDGAYLVLGREWHLQSVDRHERPEHQRIEVTLGSGTTAWIYAPAEDA